jgi:hypothetical protein
MPAIDFLFACCFEFSGYSLVEIAFTNLRKLGDFCRFAKFVSLHDSLLLPKNGLQDFVFGLLLE